jgi:hypothetical protein
LSLNRESNFDRIRIMGKIKHGDTEKKDEDGRMMDEKEEAIITISSFIPHTFYVLSVPLCLRV